MSFRFTTGAADRHIAVAIVLGGLLLQLPALLWGLPGAKALNNALRILDGEVPYRDFWSMYAPGHFYLTAIVFKVFGTHYWGQGVVVQLLNAINGALLFMIVRRLGLPLRPALIVGFAFALIEWGHTELSSYPTVLPFVLTGLDRVIRYLQGRGAGQLIVAGLLFGVGAWFKHDVAFYVATGTAVGVSIAWLLLRGPRPDTWVSPVGVFSRVAGGALITALPVAALLAWKAGPDAWQDLIVFPASDFRVVRSESYPPIVPDFQPIGRWMSEPFNLDNLIAMSRYLPTWIQANVPQLVFLVAAAALWLKRRSLTPDVIGVSALSLATMTFFWASAHVQQNTNFTSLWILSIILGALAWASGRVRPAVRIALVLLFVVATGSFVVGSARHIAEIAYFWNSHRTLDFPRVAGVRVAGWQYDVYHPIVSFIRRHVPESEPIYAGLGRHDSVVISDQRFYFLAGRRIASRYGELHPGIVDRQEVQREIIADLERLNVRCVVLWHFGWPRSQMETILASRRREIPEIGSTLLDEYLRREFQQVARYGEYALLWRKTAVPIPVLDKPEI